MRTTVDKLLFLEDSEGSAGDLITIKTSRKKDTIKDMTTNIKSWLENKHFTEFKNKEMDLAIVVYVNKQRMKMQDVDNIAKVVLDALKKPEPYLFENDSQVIRLLVYKMLQKPVKDYNTDAVIISFREYNPDKQMILVDRTSRFQKEEDF